MRTKPFSMERVFRALADRTRLRVLNLIGEQELCVCYFVEILGTGQPKISRHLAYLRNAGLVDARREGKWMHYRIVRPANAAAERILNDVLAWMKRDPEMQRDRALLNTACCSPGRFVTLQSAPRPSAAAMGAK
jgi:ArsR family transcriptional regulator